MMPVVYLAGEVMRGYGLRKHSQRLQLLCFPDGELVLLMLKGEKLCFLENLK